MDALSSGVALYSVIKFGLGMNCFADNFTRFAIYIYVYMYMIVEKMTRGRDEWSNKWQQRSSLAPCSAGAGGQGGGIPGRGAGSSDRRSARFQTGGEAHRHRHHPRRWPAWDSTPQTGMLSERGMTHSVWEFCISATFESEGCVLKRFQCAEKWELEMGALGEWRGFHCTEQWELEMGALGEWSELDMSSGMRRVGVRCQGRKREVCEVSRRRYTKCAS